ncbi:MAG: deoxyribodipyrimidine photo-lyase [Spirochaetes bacterium]|nr:deoxyribodipyrimidine photo-lyase [Spirochaetota bacterium]
MIQEQRIQSLNDRGARSGSYVLYWMQQSQRAECNHALEYAIDRANHLGLPVVVFFGLTGSFPGANARHYAFMLEGLRQVGRDLNWRGILLVTRIVSPEKGAVEMARQAALAVTDRGYLRIQKEWRAAAAERIACGLVQVESDVVVPVETASPKEEYSAGTFRPKITRLLYGYLAPLKKRRCGRSSLGMNIRSDDIGDTAAVLRRLRVDDAVQPVGRPAGGTAAAKRLLSRFIERKLDSFGELRNDPAEDNLSCMSPYLHFGQIAPLQIALDVLKSGSPGKDRYLEELIVRRELAMNFVHYNPAYDQYACLPAWAKKTLAAHRRDRREYVYSRDQLERAATHDRYWNAAQTEMVLTGKMHGYMRMYWGKKILEWSRDPKEAFNTALYLNNRYSIDGRDPNGFAGVAWCFGKHDRAWPERAIFGKVRYMNDRGLERKFDMDAYCARVGSAFC